MENKEYKILFICLGNICRSPAAEGVMRRLTEENGTDPIGIDSAGLHDYHEGELPDHRMRDHAARRGYNLTHRSRPVTAADFERFDLVVGMDGQNIRALNRLAPSPEARGKIRRMTDYLSTIRADSVPDPYYGGPEGFERVLDLLEEACAGLLERLQDGNA